MNEPVPPAASPGYRYVIAAAAVVVVLAGAKLAASVLTPLLLALVISVICLPPLKQLQRRGVPTAVGVALILLGLAALFAAVPLFVTTSLRDLKDDLGLYQAKLQAAEVELAELLEQAGVADAEDGLLEHFDPKTAAGLLQGLLNSLVSVVGNAMVVLFLVAFMLAEASHVSDKLLAAFGTSTQLTPRIKEVFANIWKYLTIKTLVSFATGLIIFTMLWVMGIKYALLWGFLAFCFNYIPNIGSILAAVPVVVLALLEHGPGTAAAVAVGYLAVNNILGVMIEPRLQGEGLGLSPLVVFVSLLFWGFIFGPVGMLLSAPLTMAVKIACDSDDDTRPLAVLLGPKVRPQPTQTA